MNCWNRILLYRPGDRAVNCSFLRRDVWQSNLGPIKSDTCCLRLSTAAILLFSSKESCVARLQWGESEPANSSHFRCNTASLLKDLVDSRYYQYHAFRLFARFLVSESTKLQSCSFVKIWKLLGIYNHKSFPCFWTHQKKDYGNNYMLCLKWLQY